MHRKLLAFSLLTLVSTSHAGVVSINPASFAPGTEITRAFEHVTLFTLAPDFSQGVPVSPELPALKYIPVYAFRCSDCPAPLTNKMMFGTRFRWLENPNGDLSPIWSWANRADSTLSGESYLFPAQPFDALYVQFDQPTDFVEIVNSGTEGMVRGNFFRLTAWDENGKQILVCSSFATADEEVPRPGCSTIHGQSIADPTTLIMRIRHPRIAFVTAGGWAGDRYAISLKYNQLGCGRSPHPHASDEMDSGAEDSQELPPQ